MALALALLLPAFANTGQGSATYPASSGALTIFGRTGQVDGLYAIGQDGHMPLVFETWGGYPTWSAAGDKVAYVRWDYGNDLRPIFVANADGSSPLKLTDGDSNERDPSFSPDGTKLVFAEFPNNDGMSFIYTINADGTGLHQVIPNRAYEPTWSPDGERIAYKGFETCMAIFTVDPEGQDKRQVSSCSQEIDWAGGPDWSPDGTEIVFPVYHDDGTPGLAISRADGSRDRIIMRGQVANGPAWSPDGKLIAFLDPDENDVFVIRPDGSGLRRVTDHGVFDLTGPAWQPNGAVTPPDPQPVPPVDPPPDVTPPTVEITTRSPVVTPAYPYIEGRASDDRSVSRVLVSLFDVVGQEHGPYPAACRRCSIDLEVNWTIIPDVPPGWYTIRAMAQDAAGNESAPAISSLVFIGGL